MMLLNFLQAMKTCHKHNGSPTLLARWENTVLFPAHLMVGLGWGWFTPAKALITHPHQLVGDFL